MWLFEENTYFHLSSQVIHSKKKWEVLCFKRWGPEYLEKNWPELLNMDK